MTYHSVYCTLMQERGDLGFKVCYATPMEQSFTFELGHDVLVSLSNNIYDCVNYHKLLQPCHNHSCYDSQRRDEADIDCNKIYHYDHNDYSNK